MKILLVTQDFYPERGGIQSYCLELAIALTQLGVGVTVLCPGSPSLKHNFPFQIIRKPVFHTSFFFLRLFNFLPQHTRQHQYSCILLAQWQNAIGLMLPFSKPLNTPVICMIHGRELMWGVFRSLTPFVAKKAFVKVDRVVANSSAVKNLFLKTVPLPKPVEVIFPGVDANRFFPRSNVALRQELKCENKKIILTITRLVKRKNIDLVIKAVHLLKNRFPDIHYFVGGIGPEMEYLIQLRDSLNLQSTITFLGLLSHDRLPEYVNLADIFVLPSSEGKRDIEGFGIVFSEAAACSIPSIGAATGGIPDAISDGVTGVLINDLTPKALQDAIETLLLNPEKRQQMGLAARNQIWAGRTWKHCAENYYHLIKKYFDEQE